MAQNKLKSFEPVIFFHNKNELKKRVNIDELEKSKLANLNDFDIPDSLRINDMEINLNKAILSEYLGILSYKTTSPHIGCFTYSIQSKFSYNWHKESGFKGFIPPIRFKDLENLKIDPNFLYMVEEQNVFKNFPKEMNDILENFFPEEKDNKNISGPYKGSFIISKEIFKELQIWLLKVSEFLFKKYDFNSIDSLPSEYDNSSISERTDDQKKIDKLRHKYGDILERAVALFLGLKYPKKNRRFIGDEISKKNNESENFKYIRSKANKNQIICVFGNIAYHKVIFQWIRKVEELKIKNYVVIANDIELYDSLRSQRKNTILIPFSGDLEQFWVFRLKTLFQILQSNLDIIHSDADAFWLKNPLDYFSNINADIVSSQGTIFPRTVKEKWGFVLCCGLQIFRSNINTLRFLENVIPKLEVCKDDQIAINEKLLENNIQWSRSIESFQLEVRGIYFECFQEIINGKTPLNLKVALLPHYLFQRLLQDNISEAFVVHPLNEKTQTDKLISLAQCEEKLSISNKNVSFQNYEVRKKIEENIIWLASYPRSGNTLFRTILKNNFGLDNFSLYNDRDDIGKFEKMRNFVGHQFGNWDNLFNPKKPLFHRPITEKPILEKANELKYPLIIKTHSQFFDYYKNKKAIYIVREPKAVYLSYVNYKLNFHQSSKNLNKEELLEKIIFDGDKNFAGHWIDHVNSWTHFENDNILVLRFEDILNNFLSVLNQISNFIGVEPIHQKLEKFESFQKVDNRFFKSGQKRNPRKDLTPNQSEKIFISSSLGIRKFGYDFKNPTLIESFIRDKSAKEWIYICTYSFNSEKTIGKTIESVLSQEGEIFIRYHIQDGGSTDNTLKIIENWKEILNSGKYSISCRNIEFTYEVDSDSRKFVCLSNGFKKMQIPDNAIMTYLNAGDVFLPGAFSSISKIFLISEKIKWVIARGRIFDQNGFIKDEPNSDFFVDKIPFGQFDNNGGNLIKDKVIFWESRLFKKVGGFNINLKYIADNALWVNFAKLEVPSTFPFHMAMFIETKQRTINQKKFSEEMKFFKITQKTFDNQSENPSFYLNREYSEQKIVFNSQKNKYELILQKRDLKKLIVYENKNTNKLLKDKNSGYSKTNFFMEINNIYLKNEDYNFLKKAMSLYSKEDFSALEEFLFKAKEIIL